MKSHAHITSKALSIEIRSVMASYRFFIFFTLVASAFAEGNDVGEGLSEYLKEIIGNLGDAMREGIPEMQVPILDPFKPPNPVNFKHEKPGASFEGWVDQINIEGLSTLKAEHVEVDVNGEFHSELVIQCNTLFIRGSVSGLVVHARIVPHFEFIKATGKYKLDGKAMRIIPIRGNGNLLLETHGVSGHLKLHLLVNPLNQILKVQSLELDLSVKKIKVNFENLINPKLSQLINEIINWIAKPLFEKVLKEKLNQKFSEELKKVIDKKLETIKFSQIKQLIGIGK